MPQLMPRAVRPAVRPLRRLAVASLAVLALAPASGALAGGTLTGRYTTKITSPAGVKGTWGLTFAKGGRYTVVDNGHVLVRGTYSVAGAKVMLGHETGDGACASAATYSWKKAGATLHLTKVHDPAVCSGRIAVLAHPFTLAG